MNDVFDALREADANRKEWVRAAMVFQRFLDRVIDENAVRHLERLWKDLNEKPLAPASEAWDLVIYARDCVIEVYPITAAEAVAAGLRDTAGACRRGGRDASRQRRPTEGAAP